MRSRPQAQRAALRTVAVSSRRRTGGHSLCHRLWAGLDSRPLTVVIDHLPLRGEGTPAALSRSAIPLGHLEKLNRRTNRAYLLKEAFREFWNYKRKGWARRFLNKWSRWATHSRLEPMRDGAWMLRRHQEDILNYFALRIDNGAAEGMNNKAKVVSHRCYGFRTAETFITALYHCLFDLPEPQLVHRFL